MNKLISAIVFFTVMFCNAQTVYHYQWRMKDNIKEGVLYYDEANDEAYYFDLHKTLRKFSEKEKEPTETNISISIGKDVLSYRVFMKKNKKIQDIDEMAGKVFLVDDVTFKGLDWQFENETQTIDGFLCNKATTHHRGRDWVVWYSTDIPVFYGPVFFEGLPGLIVKAEDTQEHHAFYLTKIEKNSAKYTQIDIDTTGLKKVTAKEFDKIKRESFDNFMDNIASQDKDMNWGETETIRTGALEPKPDWLEE